MKNGHFHITTYFDNLNGSKLRINIVSEFGKPLATIEIDSKTLIEAIGGVKSNPCKYYIEETERK